ncbi:MAG: hypothetical protein R3B93_13910 [Bacteroidia bacterium]
MNEAQTRREFLQKMKAASMAAMAASLPGVSFLSSCAPGSRVNATADSVILLWMARRMAHTETFDQGLCSLYEEAWKTKYYRAFPSVPTIVDGLSFSEGFRVHWSGDGSRNHYSFVSRDRLRTYSSYPTYHWPIPVAEPPQPIQPPYIWLLDCQRTGR